MPIPSPGRHAARPSEAQSSVTDTEQSPTRQKCPPWELNPGHEGVERSTSHYATCADAMLTAFETLGFVTAGLLGDPVIATAASVIAGRTEQSLT